MAEPIYIIEGTALNHPLVEEASQMVEKLLAPLKAINPAISTWDRARDPKYAVALRSTRRGSQPGRPFDPIEMRKRYDANRARIKRTFEVPVRPLATAPSVQARPESGIHGTTCCCLWAPGSRRGVSGEGTGTEGCRIGGGPWGSAAPRSRARSRRFFDSKLSSRTAGATALWPPSP